MADQKVVPFVFEGEQTVRVVTKDGEPWFIAADVCRAIGVQQPTKAVEKLDEDEKDSVNLTSTVNNFHGTGGGNPNVIIVSEAGLYTLILRSHDAIKPGTDAHRFRRWVTGEVLPQIRRTGRYDLADNGAKLRQVAMARRIFGEVVAVRLWLKLGLTEVDGMQEIAQGDLFAGKPKVKA